MKYFKKFVSNTYAGSANQHYFGLKDGEVRTGRIFYKIAVGGEYDYSLLFSNIIDSTYGDGNVSHKNLVIDEWQIHSARIGKCGSITDKKELEELSVSDTSPDSDIFVFDFKDVTFSGERSKTVNPGEFFNTDPIRMMFDAGEYLCLEMTFSGGMIPYHEESLLPIYIKDGDTWRYSKKMPTAGMIGVSREVKARVAYLGDSITQGIGTRRNSYLWWNALVSEKLGHDYSFWNLGIGYGRAYDASSDGAWLYKARQNDALIVCFGTNDLLRGRTEKEIENDLLYIVKTLKAEGKTVIVQTLPPFDYKGELVGMWQRINEFIRCEMKAFADLVFDTAPLLEKEGAPAASNYGSHPNEEGCAIWADKLYSAIAPLFYTLFM